MTRTDGSAQKRLCCSVIQVRYAELGISKWWQGPPPSCNALRAATNRPGVGTSRSNSLDRNGSEKMSCGSRLPTDSTGAACISIRRMVAGLPVERTTRWALRGTEFRQGAPVSHR